MKHGAHRLSLLLLLWLAPLAARGDTPSPAQAMSLVARGYQALLKGTAGADVDNVRLLARAGLAMRQAPHAAWSVAAHRRALVLYLLSGGDGAAARDAAPLFPADEAPLVKAAMAYALAPDGKDARALLNFDALTAPAEIGGALAFAQARVAGKDDPGRAMRLLDTARLLAPGGLVEEAALRRAVFLASETGDIKAFSLRARDYRARFHAAVFAANFDETFRGAFAKFWLAGDAKTRGVLEDSLDQGGAGDRATLYDHLARSAMAQRDLEGARRAMHKAAEADARFADRARLWDIAAQAPHDPKAVAAKLAEAPQSALALEDQALMGAARLVAARIQAPTPPGDAAQAPPSPGAEKAEQMMREADEVLRGAR
ncbi:MAG: hypothetical protein KGL46_10240 [Hyphomicrobiales bacterium]|nr:hypothetical protein [Hyphomicrobiales bacterium]